MRLLYVQALEGFAALLLAAVGELHRHWIVQHTAAKRIQRLVRQTQLEWRARALRRYTKSDLPMTTAKYRELAERMEARPALLGSWDTFQGSSQTRMRYAAC